MSAGETAPVDSDAAPGASEANASRSATCTPTKWCEGSADPRLENPVTAPSADATIPPYFSGFSLAVAAMVTSALDCRCAATSAGMSTPARVAPLAIRNVDAPRSGSAWGGPPAGPRAGFGHGD